MSFEYEIIDNLLPEYQQNLIAAVVTNHKTKYTFNRETVPKNFKLTDAADIPLMGSLCILKSKPVSQDAKHALEILKEVSDRLNFKIDEIIRAQINFTWVQPEGAVVSPFHQDYNKPHLVVIYYINDSDGDTILKLSNGEIINVTPRKGRALIFNGELYHAGTSPLKNKFRIVFNMNIKIKQL
jgi:hypothetical protein